jgi:hypothetical protein
MSGTTTTWGIAQLVTPSDAIAGPPQIILPDWQRGFLYYLHGANNGGMRRWLWALETQSPQLSVPQSAGFLDDVLLCAGVDPVSGHIIAQWGGTNGDPIHKIDRNSFAVIASYGAVTSSPSYPASFWSGQQIVGVECNGVGYALLKGSAFQSAIYAFRVSDTLTHAGFVGNLAGATNNRGILTRGASGAGGGSIFGTWQNVQQSATVPLYTLRIAPGAETYNPATWPATNPHISEQTIGTIAAAAIDPAWTTLQVDGIGYDAADGDVLMKVTGPSGAAHPGYLIKVSSVDATVLWSVAMGDFPLLPAYNIAGGEVGFLGVGHKDAISMASGAMTTQPLNGVVLNQIIPGITAFWDRVHGWYFARPTYTAGPGTPIAVDGTPASFTDFAIMGIVPEPPPNGGGGATPAKLALLRNPLLQFIGSPQ